MCVDLLEVPQHVQTQSPDFREVGQPGAQPVEMPLGGVVQLVQYVVQPLGLACGGAYGDRRDFLGFGQLWRACRIGLLEARREQPAQQCGVRRQQRKEHQLQHHVERGVEAGDGAGVVGNDLHDPRSDQRQCRQRYGAAERAVDETSQRQCGSGGSPQSGRGRPHGAHSPGGPNTRSSRLDSPPTRRTGFEPDRRFDGPR